MPYKVVIADASFQTYSYEKNVLEPIGAEVILGETTNDHQRIEVCKNADAILLERGPFGRNVIEKLQRCKVMVRYGVGFNEIDVVAATEKGIVVSNVPDYCVEEVADHALAILLALARRLIPAHNASANDLRDWTYRPFKPVERLRDKTVGLVGMGRIGQAFAQRISALGLKVICYDPYISQKHIDGISVGMVNLDELLANSDFISIHAPLTEETHHLLSTEEFKGMKPTAYLINCARGSVIDQEALTTALESGQIAGAGLDVLEEEPPPKNVKERLLKLHNVIITPHIGWYSEQAMIDRQIKAAETVATVLKGGRPSSVVNPEVYTS